VSFIVAKGTLIFKRLLEKTTFIHARIHTIVIRSEYIPHRAGISVRAVVHVTVQVIFQVPKIVFFLLDKVNEACVGM